MTEENKELATKVKTSIATQTVKRGLEDGVDSSDLIIPRLMLIQNTPPKTVVVDRKTCPPGALINSLTALPLQLDDKEGIPFLPIIRGVKWIRFNAQEEGKPGYDSRFETGGKIWESRDPRDPRVIAEGAWGPKGEPPIATKFIEFLIMVPSEDMPLVIGFSKTSFAAGKQLTSMVQYTKKADIFAEKYRLRAKQEQNDQKQKFYVLTVEKIGDCTPEEYKQAEAYYNGFVGRKLKVHGEEEEATPVSKRQPWED